VIHRKKNDLLYEDATCLCHNLALWVQLFLVVLFWLALLFLVFLFLDLRPPSSSSSWFSFFQPFEELPFLSDASFQTLS